jgi:hypothetical protein
MMGGTQGFAQSAVAEKHVSFDSQSSKAPLDILGLLDRDPFM